MTTTKQQHPHHDHGSDHVGAHGHVDSAALAELLDLDALVLHDYLADVTAWLQSLASDLAVTRVLDLGAGTGTGTLALAGRFPHAELIAVDVNPDMLARVRQAAHVAGVDERVSIRHADLNAGFPALDSVDVVWSAAALHELAEPDRVFRDVFEALAPGGLFAVIEMDAPPRFLPDDIGFGRAGLEARCLAAMSAEGGAFDHPNWGPRLAAAGFTGVIERTFSIDLAAPQPAVTGRYARANFARVRPGLTDRLAADDLAALDTLLGKGPDSLLHRGDLTVRTARTAWVGRRH